MKRRTIIITLTMLMVAIALMPCYSIAAAKAPAKVKLTTCKMDSVSPNTVSIKWSKVKKNVSGYQVYTSTKKNKGFKKIDTLGKSDTSGDYYTPDVGKTHYYKVRAFFKKSGKTYYGKWSNVKSVYVKETAPAVDIVFGAFDEDGVASGYPRYNTDYDCIYVSVANYSKTKTAYVSTEEICASNHMTSQMYFYIESYAYAEGGNADFIDTEENSCVPIPPRTTAFMVMVPYTDQAQISFKEQRDNVWQLDFNVSYNRNSLEDFWYLWTKNLGGSII